MNFEKVIQTGFYGDTTRWFIGTVVNHTGDPLTLGRVQVRIVGVHDSIEVDNGRDLPWASVLIPATESGLINGRYPNIKTGAQVFGIFLDGSQSQQPLVLGSIPYTLQPTTTQLQRAPGYEESITSDLDLPDQTISNPLEYTGTVVSGSAATEKAFNFFISKEGGSYTPEQAAGIVGNLAHESDGFAADVIRAERRGDNGNAHGIAQWWPARWRPFLAWCSGQGPGPGPRDARQDPYTLLAQLKWVKYELDTTESLSKARLLQCSRVDHATIEFMRKFERPATAAGYSEYPDPAYADTGVRVRNRAGETDRLNRAYSIYNAYNLIG
jgi:hypothetical protein